MVGATTTARTSPSHNQRTWLRSTDVFAVDLDDDGDIDIISASSTDAKIARVRSRRGLRGHARGIRLCGYTCCTSIEVGGVTYVRSDTSKAGTCCDGKCTYYDGTSKFLAYEGAFGRYFVTTAASEDACPAAYDSTTTYVASAIEGTSAGGSVATDTTPVPRERILACEEKIADGGSPICDAAYEATVPQAMAVQAVVAVDVDGDGAIDIISAASSAGNGISWYRTTARSLRRSQITSSTRPVHLICGAGGGHRQGRQHRRRRRRVGRQHAHDVDQRRTRVHGQRRVHAEIHQGHRHGRK